MRWWYILAGLLIPVMGFAQDGKADDPVFELSPFEVETTGDVGYLAGAQISMTSMNELIRDTPANISVVTTELIEDLQATDFKEALDYESGIFLDTFENQTAVNTDFASGDTSPSSNVDVGDPFANAITIRGYSVPNQQRFGFRVGAILPKYGVNFGGLTDSVATDRLEAVRGPQSLLYGINVLSGIVNVVPKTPLPVRATTLTFGVGSDDYRRASFDTTGPILKDGTLNYRVMGAYTEKGDWTDYLLDTTKYGVLQLEWRPFEKATLLAEYQVGQYHRAGGGPQFFMSDSADSSIPDVWNNGYGENFSYGLDYDNEVFITYEPDDELDSFDDPDGNFTIDGPFYGRNVLVQNPNRQYDFSSVGSQYRISGPDPYYERDESNLLLLYRHELIDDLHIELGGYFTQADAEQFGVTLKTFVDSMGALRPRGFSGDIVDDPSLAAYADPELDPTDPYGYGVGEVFTYVGSESGEVGIERHYAGYWWWKVPTSAETMQLRARVTYAFDTNFWENRIRATHRFLLGGNFTRDTVTFAKTDSLDSDGHYAYWIGGDELSPLSRTSEDPFVFRSSIFDTSVIRYNGEALVTPGRFGWRTEYPDGMEQYLQTSGHVEAVQWFRGAYGIYHGKFWEDKLTIVAGLRHDAYQVREREELYIADANLTTDYWLYHRGGNRVTPFSIGYGDQAYTQDRWYPEFSDEYNATIAEQVEIFREAYPRGTTEYNFPETLTYNTKLASFSYRVTDDVSVFGLYSEGIFPNTGQRDGLDKAIEAEQTENYELGIKVELFDSRVVGTFSVYKIKRHNATWNWPYAPNPSKWYPGPNSNIEEEKNIFSAEAIINPKFDSSGSPTQLPRYYAVQGEFVQKALDDAGYAGEYVYGEGRFLTRYPVAYELGVVNPRDPQQLGTSMISESSSDPTVGREKYEFIIVDYDKMMEVDQTREGGNPLVTAMEMAQENSLGILGRTMWWHNSSPEGTFTIHNPSAENGTGAIVPYEEEGTGFDLDFIISPFKDDSYQIKLTFSEQKREVVGTGFLLSPGYAIDSNGDLILDDNDEPYLMTTEFDRWVAMLGGQDSFEDPRNPATLKEGSSISGINLSYVPKHSFRILNKYKFREGPLEGVSVSLGMRYNSAIPTTIPIGGRELSENRFPTPDIPERFVWDTSVSYQWKMWDAAWRIALRVDNLLDDWIGEAVTVYDDPSFREPLVRRSRVYYEPRTWRLTLTVKF